MSSLLGDPTPPMPRSTRTKPSGKIGVERAFCVFDSIACDDSDVDLFFDYPRGEFRLYELIDVEEAAPASLRARRLSSSNPSLSIRFCARH
jgi:hypothetical protein